MLQGVVDIGPVKASMIASIEPVSATLFAFVWLSTPFKGIDLIGFAMILVTIFLLALLVIKYQIHNYYIYFVI